MFYKGGPKNYSKGDWLFIKVCVGLLVLTVIYGAIFGPETETSKRSTTASGKYVDAAKRAGYSGSEAEQVAEAAERLCTSTGEC